MIFNYTGSVTDEYGLHMIHIYTSSQARRKWCGMAAVAAPKICREREERKRREERKKEKRGERKERGEKRKERERRAREKDVLGLWV